MNPSKSETSREMTYATTSPQTVCDFAGRGQGKAALSRGKEREKKKELRFPESYRRKHDVDGSVQVHSGRLGVPNGSSAGLRSAQGFDHK